MEVLFADKQQIDLAEAQALAESAETTAYQLVQFLLFANDHRISGGTVSADPTPDGGVTVAPGVFLKAGGMFYNMPSDAFMNILAGAANPPANVWGTGLAADATNPRKDIICITYQKVADTPSSKTFINDSVNPPQPYTQVTNTRNESVPLFSVIHGVPSATPSEPATPSGFLKLATVLVAANATVVVDGDITNNLNINVQTLEQLQAASSSQSAFSDLLHGTGVYLGVLSAMAVTETSPQSLGIQVGSGTALLGGITSNLSIQTTVPIGAPSFNHVASENVSFASGNTQTLNTNGTPPHKIRAGSVTFPGYTESVDFTINYSAGTITRLGGGGIASGGSIAGAYDYYLPRIDLIQITFGSNALAAVVGTPAQAPIAPAASANSLALAAVLVDEGVTIIASANITDKRVYLANMQELVDSRGIYASLLARLAADDVAIAAAAGVAAGAASVAAGAASAISTHVGTNITGATAVHGIKQGPGNGLDADTVDGIHASAAPAANKMVVFNAGVQYPVADGSLIQNISAVAVNGIGAAATPTASKLCPMDAAGRYQQADGSQILHVAADTSVLLGTYTAASLLAAAFSAMTAYVIAAIAAIVFPPPFSTMTDQTSFRTSGGGPYRNTTGRVMLVAITVPTGDSSVYAYCDSASNPLTLVGMAALSGNSSYVQTIYGTMTFICLPLQYYRVAGGSITKCIEWT